MKKSTVKIVAAITVVGIILIIIAICICNYLNTDADVIVAVVGALAVIVSGVINILPDLLSESTKGKKVNSSMKKGNLSQKGIENGLYVKRNGGSLNIKQSGRKNITEIEDNKN